MAANEQSCQQLFVKRAIP